MEKLQKALSTAREKRAGGRTGDEARRASTTARRAHKKGQSRTLPPAWDTLTAFSPDPAVLLANRVLTLNAQAEAAPFDLLRTKILLLMQQNGWKRLAITSPDKECGKSTVACNLAFAFSRQQEVRSVLLDMDLRRPGISKTLGYKPEHDIVEVLLGKVKPEEQMVRWQSNLAISMANRPVNDPIQVLMSQQAGTSLDAMQETFEQDITIFDLPPMLMTDDARVVLQHVDCALIVARAEQTKISTLDICEREVAEQTNVLGMVLNDCRHFDEEEEYGGY